MKFQRRFVRRSVFAPSLFVLALAGAGCSGSVGPMPESDDETGGEAGRGGAGGRGPQAGDGGQGGAAGRGGSGGNTATAGTGGSVPVDPGDPSAPGILDCPTVAAPGYGLEGSDDSVKLSATWKSVCATCHGAYGEGLGKYPALPGALDEATYVAKVRKGGAGMPAFSAAELSDADLKADFAALAKRPPGLRSGGGAGEATWSEARVQDAYTRGLAMWRKADAEGAACANCHSPDGLDLAIIGYTDDAILRRATLHLTPQDSLVVRDFIHAQRRRFGITRPCSTDWRPFQPGGVPLEGATRAAQDLSFLKHLEQQKLMLLTDTVDTLAKAQAARDQLLGLDLRKLKLGIAFARWTEDSFNGPEHKSVNDWIPSLPRIPHVASRDAWHKLMDDYVANPTNATLYALMNGISKMTHDGGYDDWFEANAKTGNGNWITGIMLGKYESVLVAQHLFRMAVQKKPGWHELEPVPFGDYKNGYFNPWWNVGNATIGPPCANNTYCMDHYAELFPASVRAEVPADGRDALEAFTGDFSHNWFTIGELLDQGLLNSGGAGHNTTEAVYWNALKIGEHRALKDVFNSQRVVLQTMAKIPSGNHGWATVFRGDGKAPVTSPLLHGQWFKVALAGVPDMKDERAPYLVRLEGNIMRMFVLLMQDMLKAGAAVSDKATLLKGLEEHVSNNVANLIRRKAEITKAYPAMTTDMNLFAEDLKVLADDVVKRVMAAREVDSAAP